MKNILFYKLKFLPILAILLLVNGTISKAEGILSITPTANDAAALYIGAGTTEGGGDYGLFAWKGSDSKFHFNIQNAACEKAYFGFSIPLSARDFNPASAINTLIFRIVDPNGNVINNHNCFGDYTDNNGDVWQRLNTTTANIATRAEGINGPSQLVGATGYNAFELDLSACGFTANGDYTIEFFSTDPNYQNSGHYVQYFDVTVADCAATPAPITGRVWSNNWAISILRDGGGNFERAFNGAFYVCSTEGFITKIDFNSQTNTRGDNTNTTYSDQRSGFRAGSFNVSVNTTGTSSSGTINSNRQSLPDVNASNALLHIFLNQPDPAICTQPTIGEFMAAPTLLSGCPGNRCLNIIASQTGQIDLLIEGANGNGILDDPSEVFLSYNISADDLATTPQVAGFPYEACIPWDGKDGNGNILNTGTVKISGFYSQGVYHFPIYDAEYNDDGFIIQTLTNGIGNVKLYYDDTLIPDDNNIAGESKNGLNGCDGPCHRWTGSINQDSDAIFGNYNTINSWWFASTKADDFTIALNNQALLTLNCPDDFIGCPNTSISPSVTGMAASPENSITCPVTIEYEDLVTAIQCEGGQTITRTWTAYFTSTPDEKVTCTQNISLEDRSVPSLTNIPNNTLVSCENIPAIPDNIGVTDNCDTSLDPTAIEFSETTVTGACINSYILKRTWKVRDACGNATESSQTISVVDNTAPTWVTVAGSLDCEITCTSSEVEEELNSTISSSRSNNNCEIAPVAIDNCGGTVSVTKVGDSTTPGSCNGSTIRVITWKAIDACNNESTEFTTTITAIDATKPEWDEFNWNKTIACDSALPTDEPTATDICDEAVEIILVSTEEEAGDCNGKTITRKWRAIDDCDNRRTRTETITLEDTTPPTWVTVAGSLDCEIDCSNEEVEEELNNPITSSRSNNANDCETPPVATDNCSGSIVVEKAGEETSTNGCTSTRVITWRAIDACDNVSANFTTTITTIDTIKPTWDEFKWNINVSCENIPSPSGPTASDNCATTVSVTQDGADEIEAGACTGSYIIYRKWKALDDCGNKRTRKQKITVKDTTKPDWVSFPENTTASCEAIPTITPPTATDNCGDVTISSSQTTEALSCTDHYKLITTWTITDACGNARTKKHFLTIKDTTKPTWDNFPEVQIVECDAIPAAIAPVALDNCDSQVTVTMIGEEIDPGSCAGTYRFLRRWRAEDNCGNAIEKNQVFRVRDTTDPTWVNFPESITVECDAIPAQSPPAAIDNCDASVSVQIVSETQEESVCPIAFKIVRKWEAIDNCGNRITKNEVIKVRDRTAPVLLTAATNLELDCSDADPNATLQAWVDINGGATASNNCNDLTWFHECPKFDIVCGSSVVATFTAVDRCGNKVITSASIIVVDQVAPTWTSLANSLDATYTCSDNITEPIAPIATDNCGATTVTKISDVTTSGSCANNAERLIIWTATDACGNTSSNFTARITINDTAAPTLIGVPDDTKVNCGAIPDAATVTVTDACEQGITVLLEEFEEDRTCTNQYTLVRRWTATDACGNTVSEEQELIIADTEAPTLLGVPTNATVECGAIPSVPTNITAIDNCDTNVNVQFSQAESAGGCAGNIITRTWIATDVCGNTSSLFQIITVEDTTPPAITCPADISQLLSGNCIVVGRIDIDLPTATDNCDTDVTVTSSQDLTTDFPAGTTNIILTATDDCGNTSDCNFNIVMTSNSSSGASMTPQVCPQNIIVDCEEEVGQAIVSWEPPSGDVCCTSCASDASIAGFTFLGERAGHRYYLSQTAVNWGQAVAGAALVGGSLVAITDPAENAFISSFLATDQKVYIGLSDEGSEGNYYWTNGEAVDYTNWFQNQPSNSNGQQHYGQLLSDGTWNDTYPTDLLPYLVEIVCINVQQTAGPKNGTEFPVGTTTVSYTMEGNCGNTEICSFEVTVNPSITLYVPQDVTFECHENLGGASVSWTGPYPSSCCDNCPPQANMDGFIYMGRYKGHQYYCSVGKGSWQTGQNMAQSIGGYLACINDAEENAVIAGFLRGQSAYIGFTDRVSERNFQWVSGDPIAYRNWEVNQPNNTNGGQDYAQILSNGKWDDISGTNALEFIIEVPCLEVEQIAGLPNGSVFPPGVNTVTYTTTDACGNTATESFNVTINACEAPKQDICTVSARDDRYLWINRVSCGSINNLSGRNGGYGNFTNQSTTFTKGSIQRLDLAPGFNGGPYWAYWSVWIDYNQDGDFDDSGELVVNYRQYQPIRINFRIPSNCVTGRTIMRVAMNYSRYAGSCESFTYGEIEDYSISLADAITNESGFESRSGTGVDLLGPSFPMPNNELPVWSLTNEMPSLKAYPNPVKDLLTLDINHIAVRNARLTIYNSIGQIIHQQAVETSDYQQLLLHVEDYKEGIYFISVNGDNLKPLLQKFTKL